MSDRTENNQWWHMVVATPIALPIGGLLGGALALFIVLPFGILYPYALWRDTQYIRAESTSWNPNPRLYGGLGVLAFPVTFGVLCYVISPIYLYRRFKHL